MSAIENAGSERLPRLAMSILVRDEASLIRHHLAFHRHMGVDGFVITDNGSVDGTREILAALARDYPIALIDEPEHVMAQDHWVNRMAEVAERQLGADWVINSDADEFWVPSRGSLKEHLPSSIGGLLCRRFNLLPDRDALADPGYEFYRNVFKVVRPRDDPGNRFPRHATLNTEFPFSLLRIQPKVLCRLSGRKWIGYGNHTVKHRAPVVSAQDVEVYHYPIRTFPEFERKVINHGTSLANNPRIPLHSGWHVRRWYELYRRGWLREEYDRLVPSSDCVRRWMRDGVVAEDRSIRDLFESEAFDVGPGPHEPVRD
jgi:hypothetical protein